jgi:hypothetical protein
MDVCGHRELQSLLLEWFGSVGDKVLAPKMMIALVVVCKK